MKDLHFIGQIFLSFEVYVYTFSKNSANLRRHFFDLMNCNSNQVGEPQKILKLSLKRIFTFWMALEPRIRDVARYAKKCPMLPCELTFLRLRKIQKRTVQNKFVFNTAMKFDHSYLSK